MSGTLLVLALGPVQDFIERARRMRDLWFGSHLLSEASRAAARSLAESGWTLVHPALSLGEPELELCVGMRRADGQPPLGIVNKVVAVREGATDAETEEAAAVARGAAIEAWQTFARVSKQRYGRLLADELLEDESPEGVVTSLLEFFAAWTPFDADGDFATAREEVERALAARKTLRDFTRWKGGAYPKSSLDGFRESVLVDREPDERRRRPRALARKLRLGEAEHLDGVGFVKRAGGEPDQFVPLARIAVEPWLSAAQQAAAASPALRKALDALHAACERDGVPRCRSSATQWLRDAFPFDAELFFEGQWGNIDIDLPETDDEDPQAASRARRRFCERHVRPLFRDFGLPEPLPYVACLVADGDSMGAAMSRLRTSDEHAAVSRALAGFARAVRAIVEQHGGVQIYAGGDDVLAFLPVANVVACADELRRRFTETLAQAFEAAMSVPTLSVGVGIGHTLTPLGDLVALAREAERLAKEGDELPPGDPRRRNALALVVDKRSGGQARWRAQWSSETAGEATPVGRLDALVSLLVSGRMPRRLPYELRDLLVALADIASRDDLDLGRAYRHEVERIIARKRPETGGLDGQTRAPTPSEFGLALPAADECTVDALHAVLSEWVSAAEVAMMLGDAALNSRRAREACAPARLGAEMAR